MPVYGAAFWLHIPNMNTMSTRDKVVMSTVEMQIATRSSTHRGALTNLHQFIDEAHIKESFMQLNRGSTAGVDGVIWKDYQKELDTRVPALLNAFKAGRYRAPHIRRAYIPKGSGEPRALGIPTIEDKLLQMTVYRTLSPVYEQMFYDHSYGFRPGKTQHQALGELFEQVSYQGKRYILDADLEDYFGCINHQRLRELLDLRIKDGVIRKMLDKWLKAGVLEGDRVHYPTTGTPQGGTISPLLSNIYLHYVLDEWFVTQIQPRLTGKSFLLRYADDFVLGFTHKEDALRVQEVLPKRLSKYDLKLHPGKTKLIEIAGGGPNRSFDFLGFRHYGGKSRKGRFVLKRKTSRKKQIPSLKKMNLWLKDVRHTDVSSIIQQLNQKLRGYYNYYGITFNGRSLSIYHGLIQKMLFKWLNRRGGKSQYTWERFTELIKRMIPLEKPRIRHSYLLANP